MTSLALGAGDLARVRPRRSTVWLWLAIGLALVVLCLSCQQSYAHATLTGTEPSDGAILDSAPVALILTFNEPVSPLAATLIAPGGETTPLDELSSSGSTISIALPADPGNGSHAISWRAVSDDGHPIAGTTFFVVGASSGEASPSIVQETSAAVPALWAARAILFLSLFFGVGGAAFRMLGVDLPRHAALLCKRAMIVGLLAAPAVIGLQGLDLLGSDLSGLLEGRSWALGISSNYGTTAVLAMISLLLGLATLRAQGRLVQVTGIIALLTIGLAFSMSGHASAAQPQWLTKPALFVHVTTIAWWVGALFPLVLILRQDRRTASPPLISFSRAIPYAIVPLVLSGIILAFVQLGAPSAAWWSPYGLILAVKLALLMVLFSIASWNRWVLTAPAAAGERRALKLMRRGIVAEMLIILAILGVVSAWRFTPPPRALAAAPAPVIVEMAGDGVAAMLIVDPARVGNASARIKLTGQEGKLLAPKAVKVSLEPENSAVSPIVRPARQTEDGSWVIDHLTIPVAGDWSAKLEVRISDFELIKLEGEFKALP